MTNTYKFVQNKTLNSVTTSIRICFNLILLLLLALPIIRIISLFGNILFCKYIIYGRDLRLSRGQQHETMYLYVDVWMKN